MADFRTATDDPPRDVRPVVGMSVNVDGETSRLHKDYTDAVTDAGGVPLLIPATTDPETLRIAVESVDALILTGGPDVDGSYFGEKTLEGTTDVDPFRDSYDFLLLRLAADRQLPILGICRGAQVINIAFGGDIWQDIPSQYENALAHSAATEDKGRPVHDVSIKRGSRLEEILGRGKTGVNSRHHQAVRNVAPGFTVSASAPDGIAEAIEAYPLYRIMGVQWHPENMATGGNAAMKALFSHIVSEARLFRKAKEIHRAHLIVDSHCDTPMLFEEHDIDIGRREPAARLDLVKMGEGMLDAAFVVAYLPQGERSVHAREAASEKAQELLESMLRQINSNGKLARQAFSFADADRIKAEGRKAIFLGVENGYAIGRDLGVLSSLRDMGVAYMTLCHNGDNDICDSASGQGRHGGLSPFGREVVREMNRLGMAIDLSHAAESTFYDVMNESSAPVIASHSSARALCDHQRNLGDDQLRALADKGGVAQVCLYGGFLAEGREATITDAVDHVEHIIKTAGIDHAGIGSDFDGGGGIAGCNGANEMINITVELLRRGYAEEEIAKIWGGNLRRAMDRIQGCAKV